MLFRLTSLALLGALAACDVPRSKEPAQPTAQEREATAVLSKRQAYELSERCGKTAGEEFRREWKQGLVNTKTGQMLASFTNHYNSRLNKCFYLLRITHFTKKKSAGDRATMNLSMTLADINEGKEFGNYFGAPTGAMKPVTGHPYDCKVLDKLCSSEAEWEALVKPYMED
jgi:hypothetical protein